MICADDVSSHRHRNQGLCTHNDSNVPDIGLQTRNSGRGRLFRSWHHRKFIPFCLRWKHTVQRFGLILIFVISELVMLVIWVSQMALAEFTTVDSFLFASIGDFGSGTETQDRVARQMAIFASEHQIKFVTGLGDNFYEAGISNLDDKQLVEKFEEVYKNSYLTTIPWFVALGDHDHRGNITAQVLYSQRSPIWRMPAPYFVKHICHGQGLTLDLIVTDSVGLEGAILHTSEPRRFEFEYNQALTGKVAGLQQMVWLKDILKHSTADWIIIVGHCPLYSVASQSQYPIEHWMYTKFMPMFKKYGVDAYLHGHDHVGQHSIRGDSMVHIGNGVGGYINQHIRSVDKETIWSHAKYHGFCMHHITTGYMVISFINSHGVTLHQAIIKNKRKQRAMDRQNAKFKKHSCLDCFKKNKC